MVYVCVFGSNTWMSIGISYCLISACVVEQVTNKNNFAESNDDDDGDRIEVGLKSMAHTWDRCFYAIASTYNETTSMLTHTYKHTNMKHSNSIMDAHTCLHLYMQNIVYSVSCFAQNRVAV